MKRQFKDNTLYFDGCSTVALAEEYGTPLYVFSKTAIEQKCSELKTTFVERYPNTRVAYACKAFCTIGMCKIIDSFGMSLDVVSGGELYTAIKAGFPGERIEFNGNNKLPMEIRQAVDYGVGRFIVDSFEEVALIEEICQEKGRTANLLIRVSPAIDMQGATHTYITTASKDTKFGVPIENDIVMNTVRRIEQSSHLNYMGLHFHVGSQLTDYDHHMAALRKVLTIVRHAKRQFQIETKELNLGGGFGIKYLKADVSHPYAFYLDPLMEEIYRTYEELDMLAPNVVIEPGRSIVGEAGITIYSVGNIKKIPNGRTYVSIDGGMTDNIRPGLYQALYEGVVANKAEESFTQVASIAGKCCESTDILIKDTKLPDVEVGDYYAMFSTGAYGFSMANNYNRICIPAVVMVKDGQSELMVRRQSYEQMTQNDCNGELLF